MIATALSDAELLAQARQGDEAAFTELYVRHESAARRLASSYRRAGDPDDLVNEAFERVLTAIKRGAGPDEAFRAYLFVTLRRLAIDRIARTHDDPVDEVPEPVRAEEQTEPLDPSERQIVLSAYESLPERWQAVLWQTAVEGRQPRELAPAFGMSANAAAALAYRAREKLRQAYLQAHLTAAPRPGCEPHRSRLGAYVRDGLGRRDRSATETHVGDCAACTALLIELRDIDRMLVRSVEPFFVSSSSELGGAVGGALVAGGVTKVWTKARSNPGIVAGVAAVAAAALAFALVVGRGGQQAGVPSPTPPDESAAPPAPGESPAPASPAPASAAPPLAQAASVREPDDPPQTTPATPETTSTPSTAAAVRRSPSSTTAPSTTSPRPSTTLPPSTTTTVPPPTPSTTTPPLLDVELDLNLLVLNLGLDLEI
jgi:RNA polymerase sigma factor (sigma-70 family)